jgi:excisionase family DNA binding protein
MPIVAKANTATTRLGQTRLNRAVHGEGGVTMSEPWVSAEEIAAHLGVTKDTVYTWIADKAMPAHKVGRLWKFQASEVDAWVRSGGAGGK